MVSVCMGLVGRARGPTPGEGDTGGQAGAEMR